jgi:hypothetical protein
MEISGELKVQNNAYSLQGDAKRQKESPWLSAMGSLKIGL